MVPIGGLYLLRPGTRPFCDTVPRTQKIHSQADRVMRASFAWVEDEHACLDTVCGRVDGRESHDVVPAASLATPFPNAWRCRMEDDSRVVTEGGAVSCQRAAGSPPLTHAARGC